MLIHIRLKHPIMVDKKKTHDIQFYREVVDSAIDETGNRRRAGGMDRDEIESEENERRHRKKQNKELKEFAQEIADKVKSCTFFEIFQFLVNKPNNDNNRARVWLKWMSPTGS